MAKSKEPSNAWEYTDWLYVSNRLTAEEYNDLKKHLLKLEETAGIAALIEEGVLTEQGC